MRKIRNTTIILAIAGLVLAGLGTSHASPDDYNALKGVDSPLALFDMRDGNPKSAAIHLNLIHNTFKELVAAGKNPEFVVVFMAGSVKLISSDHSGFEAEAQHSLKEISGIISKMSEAGIHMQVCLFAVNLVGVDPTSILPKIERVGNGWISEIAYQAKGYSLVPVY
jgi:intracellular sulfur oxidation DsrE/DsrF family protein